MDANQPYIFSRKFKGKIWKTFSNTTGDYLAIEVRESSEHQVSFFILDTNHRRWLWQDVTFEEQWWINLRNFGERELQFVYYEDGNSPDQKQYLTIDIHTREVREKTREAASEIPITIRSPAHYRETTAHFTTVSKFLQQRLNIFPVKAVDYLESEQLLVISYYLWKSDHLDNFLLIMDDGGTIRSHLLLADDLQAIGIDTFFMIKSSIYTIRDKAELLIYDIQHPN